MFKLAAMRTRGSLRSIGMTTSISLKFLVLHQFIIITRVNGKKSRLRSTLLKVMVNLLIITTAVGRASIGSRYSRIGVPRNLQKESTGNRTLRAGVPPSLQVMSRWQRREAEDIVTTLPLCKKHDGKGRTMSQHRSHAELLGAPRSTRLLESTCSTLPRKKLSKKPWLMSSWSEMILRPLPLPHERRPDSDKAMSWSQR
ncbi:hypothetical protein F4819DRAFT_451023 [Hypoxylon fuscum]|nr:hypothetical protein F4819DRAFT_451023 [Hypoxylon fuscum]